jgi:hypothetical protein
MSTHKLPAAPDGGQHFFGAKFHTIAKIKIKKTKYSVIRFLIFEKQFIKKGAVCHNFYSWL